jgi:multiple antibiotic resistance protein
MLEDQSLLLNQLFTLWAMLDPIGHLPLFLGATNELTRSERRRAAYLSVVFALAILIFFGIAGQFLLHAMGISLLSFQIAGGIILLLFSLRMVLGEARNSPHSDEPTENTLDVAIYPLATPIIAGPGAMLAIVLLTDNHRFTPLEQVTTFGLLALILTVMVAVFLLGEIILRLIGHGGINVLHRVMGVILSALSINLIVSALSEWLKLPPI